MNILNYAGYFSFFLVLLKTANEIIKLVSPIKSSFLGGKYFSWNEVNRYISKLAKEIRGKNIEYGLICGTGRGGGIIAALLSYKLKLTPVLVWDRKYAIDDASAIRTSICIEDRVVLDAKFSDLYTKPVLLVTPQSDPGVTLNKYIEVLKASGFSGRIDKCAIIASERTLDTDLEYCLKRYRPETTCRKFPWEKNNPDLMDITIHI